MRIVRKTFKKISLLTLSGSVLMSCAPSNNNNAPVTARPNNPITTVAAVPDLLGTWTKPCAGGGTTGTSKNQFVVEADKLQIQDLVFENNRNCSGVADLESHAIFGYSVDQFVAGRINPINLKLQKVLARLNTSRGIAIANTTSFCGEKDWQINTDKDVTGKNCLANVPAVGETYFQIFKVSASELFIGEVNTQHTGRTAESRPVVLETTSYKK